MKLFLQNSKDFPSCRKGSAENGSDLAQKYEKGGLLAVAVAWVLLCAVASSLG